MSHCSPEAPAAGVFTRYLFVKTYLDLKRLLYFRIEWIEQEKTERNYVKARGIDANEINARALRALN